MEAGDQQLVHTPFVPAGYWSPCAPLVWNPVKALDIRFSSSHFSKQHPRHEKAVSRISLAEAIYAWPCMMQTFPPNQGQQQASIQQTIQAQQPQVQQQQVCNQRVWTNAEQLQAAQQQQQLAVAAAAAAAAFNPNS
ncbi:unnamed protein product, partial [Schistosoma curassoni]|uniref:Uncharacterized protein n=1 Tax=Schistosoma curassoni TaxID=6186 RepID=A0A183JSS3_9TREM